MCFEGFSSLDALFELDPIKGLEKTFSTRKRGSENRPSVLPQGPSDQQLDTKRRALADSNLKRGRRGSTFITENQDTLG